MKVISKIDLLRNRFGTILGIKINDILLPSVRAISIEQEAAQIPKVTLELYSTNINFIDIDTTGLKVK